MNTKTGSYNWVDFKTEMEILLFRAKTLKVDVVISYKGRKKDGGTYFAYLSNSEKAAAEEIMQNAHGYQIHSTRTEAPEQKPLETF